MTSSLNLDMEHVGKWSAVVDLQVTDPHNNIGQFEGKLVMLFASKDLPFN